MGNVTQIRPVKDVFSRASAEQQLRKFTTKIVQHVALELMRETDDAGRVEMTTQSLCERTGWRVLAIRRALKELERAGVLVRDPRIAWRFSWDAEKINAIAEQAGVAKISLCITTLSWCTPDEQSTLDALSAGYARSYARRTRKESGGEAIRWSPELPRSPETCRRMISKIARFARSIHRDIDEVARYSGEAYVYDEGAWKKTNGPPPWTWFEHSNLEAKALELMQKARARRDRKRDERKADASPMVDAGELASRAAQVARAAGMGGARG